MTVGGGAPQQVQLSPGMIVFGGRGGRTNEGRVQVDGLNTGASLNGGGVSGYRQDIENSAEISMTTSGGLGEAEVGGPAMNIIPRTGGNTFTGHFFGTGLNSSMQSDNFTERVIAAGLTRPNRINYNYDTSLSSGGPIVKDRLWYFGLVYYRGSGNDINMFHNKNAGDITKWTYVRDPDRPAKSDGYGPLQPALRLTFQVSPRNKLGLFWDEQISNNSIGQGSSDRRARNGRLQSRLAARAAGEVHRDVDQPPAARSGPGDVPVQLEHARAAGQRSSPDSGHRTVSRCHRLRRQWEYRRPDLPRPEHVERRLDRGAHLERGGIVCDRRPQHEVRLPGRLPRGQSRARRQQPGFPRRQRRAEPVDTAHHRLPHVLARSVLCVLRAGPVDPRPADAAGGPPLRPSVEHLP